MKDLAGRCAVVTGASRGIGPVVAHALAREGMNLVLAARTADELAQVGAALEQRGAHVLTVPTDVGDASARRTLVETAIARFGAIDVLVNNAGVERTLPFDRLAPEEIEAVVRVNLTAPLLLTSLVLPGMLARGRGHIVQMSSLAGKQGAACLEIYGATKAALIVFTQALRASYRRSGVSASVVTPGFVEAGMYTRANELVGPAPALLGTVSAGSVARAVVRAIRRDSPEIIVNGGPTRPLLLLAALSPRLAERLPDWLGANAYLRREGAAMLQAEASRATAEITS